MSNIKVIVDYELPSNDKFDALLEQYLQAKAITDAAKETMIPLITEGGRARYEAICDQLDVIVDQLKKIVVASDGISASATGWYTDKNGNSFRMIACYHGLCNKAYISYRERHGCISRDFLNWEYNKEDLLSLDGLVTRWNDFNIIEEMQRDCNRQLQNMIDTQQQKAKIIAGTLGKIRE